MQESAARGAISTIGPGRERQRYVDLGTVREVKRVCVATGMDGPEVHRLIVAREDHESVLHFKMHLTLKPGR